MRWKIIIFYTYFFNMDISVTLMFICLKICLHVAEIYPEGRVSQNFDIGLSFCLM